MSDQNNSKSVDANKDSGKATAASAQQNEQGRNVIEDAVVAKVAGIAAREVSGVHSLGGGAARFVGSIRESFGGSENVQQGVDVEVGETQAAVDLSIVAEYGVAIHELADAIRKNIVRAIERLTGLEVTEVNVTVTDVHLFDEDDDEDDQRAVEARNADANPRVQ